MNKLNTNKYALIDLHLHLDGSLSIKTIKELIKMQNIDISLNDNELIKLLQVDENCRDLNEYLKKFEFPLRLLQSKEAISTAVYNLQEELLEQGLIYAEIRFAPQLHLREGLTQREVIEAAIQGLNRSKFNSNLILCTMRGNNNYKENMETVELAKEYLNKGVCAVDLAGAEAVYPTKDFKDIFELTSKLNIPYTIHAGEAAGPESIYKAIEFGAKRIGHGVRASEDDELMRLLQEKGIILELCPTSNLNTNIYGSINEYPIRKFIKAGVKVTINTDNMMVSNTNLNKEYEKITETFNLTEKELKEILKNSLEAIFASEATKKILTESYLSNHKLTATEYS